MILHYRFGYVFRITGNGNFIRPPPKRLTARGMAADNCSFPLRSMSGRWRPEGPLFDKEILIHDQFPTDTNGPELLKHFTVIGRHRLEIWNRHEDRLHECKSPHIHLMPHCVMESKCRTPVVNNKCNIFEMKFFDKFLDVFDMIEKLVVDIRFIRFTHTNQVRCNTPPQRL